MVDWGGSVWASAMIHGLDIFFQKIKKMWRQSPFNDVNNTDMIQEFIIMRYHISRLNCRMLDCFVGAMLDVQVDWRAGFCG